MVKEKWSVSPQTTRVIYSRAWHKPQICPSTNYALNLLQFFPSSLYAKKPIAMIISIKKCQKKKVKIKVGVDS